MSSSDDESNVCSKLIGHAAGAAAFGPLLVWMGTEGVLREGLGGVNAYYFVLAAPFALSGLLQAAITGGKDQPACKKLLAGLVASGISVGSVALGTVVISPEKGLDFLKTLVGGFAGVGAIIGGALGLGLTTAITVSLTKALNGCCSKQEPASGSAGQQRAVVVFGGAANSRELAAALSRTPPENQV